MIERAVLRETTGDFGNAKFGLVFLERCRHAL
jgi:hypothetical protein